MPKYFDWEKILEIYQYPFYMQGKFDEVFNFNLDNMYYTFNTSVFPKTWFEIKNIFSDSQNYILTLPVLLSEEHHRVL